jgi:hypothetical protein
VSRLWIFKLGFRLYEFIKDIKNPTFVGFHDPAVKRKLALLCLV